jgi:hypothetical protein
LTDGVGGQPRPVVFSMIIWKRSFRFRETTGAHVDPQLLDEQNEQHRNQESPSAGYNVAKSESREAGIE